ncbi:class I SAM-dependent methyltransferase [Sphingobacterium suaedae]|uniref:Class I SAM-dependent methyltransferase n=1 Tax=Sphingobacterium suaedae TaxID=1686402 RepID=A0ABW5KGX9_9SPHI
MNQARRDTSDFSRESYARHADWYNTRFPGKSDKQMLIENLRRYDGSINHWLQKIFFQNLTPLLFNKQDSWLTVGDAYGHDARYLLDEHVLDVTASDINGDFLAVAQEMGFIEKYAEENAEALSYSDGSIDYVFCKESYHHFPRPYLAMYEMLRVARKGVVVMEPQDPIQKMSFLLFLSNVLGLFNDRAIQKVWKKRFSYEPVGNFVYKISEREFEKLAAGLNLPTIAVKRFNPNFWFPGSDQIPAKTDRAEFRRIAWKKWCRDFLSRYGLFPSQSLSIIVFKQRLESEMQLRLIQNGYRLIEIPVNPYV